MSTVHPAIIPHLERLGLPQLPEPMTVAQLLEHQCWVSWESGKTWEPLHEPDPRGEFRGEVSPVLRVLGHYMPTGDFLLQEADGSVAWKYEWLLGTGEQVDTMLSDDPGNSYRVLLYAIGYVPEMQGFYCLNLLDGSSNPPVYYVDDEATEVSRHSKNLAEFLGQLQARPRA